MVWVVARWARVARWGQLGREKREAEREGELGLVREGLGLG